MDSLLMRVVFSKNYPGLGEKIREFRKKSGKSMTELAANAGISYSHWNRIENEKVRDLPVETLRGMEKALGKSLVPDRDE
ncbi:putative transcriptional regulator [Xenococcus sp. PCC 7305]|uniref:helix-turn-helix domain-containing protein n=1 Tax=Xenococcus sp. PCC 7305 TaxID=102125 RepID=UPI0002AC7100|nr:helix-turn-helix transcriptional regulator [Xenococcus sp. PCC 7305]ELS01145.1 putative transcriptional regulator [Xenococcus sp. PCC 7305]